MLRYYYTIFCLFVLIGHCFSQTQADSLTSPVKTLSYKQYNAYLNGDDYDSPALVAELNHYPSPQKTIELQKQLGLSPNQLFKIKAINTELLRKKKEMGRFIIKNERALDSLFRLQIIDDGTLIFYTNRYGLYQGELRNAVLQAYLKVGELLTTDQLKKYRKL